MLVFKLFTDGLRLTFGRFAKQKKDILPAHYFTAEDVSVLQKSLQQLKEMSGIFSLCAQTFKDEKLIYKILPDMTRLVEDTPEYTKHFMFQSLKLSSLCNDIATRMDLMGEKYDASLYVLIPKIDELFSYALNMCPDYLGATYVMQALKGPTDSSAELASRLNLAISKNIETAAEMKQLRQKRESFEVSKSMLLNKHHSDFDLAI